MTIPTEPRTRVMKTLDSGNSGGAHELWLNVCFLPVSGMKK